MSPLLSKAVSHEELLTNRFLHWALSPVSHSHVLQAFDLTSMWYCAVFGTYDDSNTIPAFEWMQFDPFYWSWQFSSWMKCTINYFEDLVQTHLSLALMPCFSLTAKQDSYSSGFLCRISSVTFWLAEAAQLIGSRESSSTSVRLIQRSTNTGGDETLIWCCQSLFRLW